MSEAILSHTLQAGAARPLGATLLAIAWRNLWRNRRRTWLTAGGIAFALMLVVFARSLQDGSFAMMIDNATRFYTGQIQIQHPKYRDDPRMRYTIANAAALAQQLASVPGVVTAAPRGVGFALISVDERSFGAQVLGVVPDVEFARINTVGVEGRFLARPGEAFVGSALARNLGAAIGDELVILGTGKDGGVAAAAASIVGTFTSGQAELDRSLVEIHLADFQEAFGLEDEVHVLALITEDVAKSEQIASDLAGRVRGEGLRFLPWYDLVPELQQMIEMKHVSGNMIFSLLTVLVTFSVVNSFIMTVFERTQEFGMLKAIGMRPSTLILMLQVEAFWMSVLGIALGIGVSAGVIGAMSIDGLYLGEEYAEILEQYHMPDRLYPSFSIGAALVMGAVMLVATQLAAVLPSLRVRKMKPVEALRAEE